MNENNNNTKSKLEKRFRQKQKQFGKFINKNRRASVLFQIKNGKKIPKKGKKILLKKRAKKSKRTE